MTEPLAFDKMIALVTTEALEGAVVAAWYACVKRSAPSGTLLVLPGIEDGTPRRVCLVHRASPERHTYLIPLSRDLAPEEAEAIVTAFSAEEPDLDFEIEATTLVVEPASAATDAVEDNAITIEQARYQELCTAWAKRQHETWVEARTRNGWRYGAQMSMAQKTHPLLKAWDQLPDACRVVDTHEPQMLLDLLNQQGYAVITKDELKSLLGLMR